MTCRYRVTGVTAPGRKAARALTISTWEQGQMFTLKIKTDNAAFEDAGPEVARILRDLARQLEGETGEASGRLRDLNGNTVGEYRLTK